MYISNQDDLVAFALRAANSPVLAIDTEFLREKTYYAKLCLLQMATVDEVAIVDPFAVKDLHVLADLMENPNVVKLFHAAHQDLEIIYREVGVLPHPIFDTQVAAALLGHVQQIGYAALVGAVCGVQLKKLDSYTDWSRRPLTASQLEYAGDDVIYLPKMYESMVDDLKAKGRLEWVSRDFEDMVDPANYKTNPRERYVRLKRATQLSPRGLAAAREVAAWREEQAMRRDVPRKWIITDEQIVEACKREARTIDQLFMVRNVKEHLSMRDSRTIVSLIAKGLDLPEDQWPELPHATKSERNVDGVVDLMMSLARLRAKQNNVALQTLVSHDDLVALARGHRDNLEVLKGWRYRMIGKELTQLVAGDIMLAVHCGEVQVIAKDQL